MGSEPLGCFQPSAVRQNPIVLEIRENVLSDAGTKKQTIVGLSHRTSDAWRPPNASTERADHATVNTVNAPLLDPSLPMVFSTGQGEALSPFISGTQTPARACMP